MQARDTALLEADPWFAALDAKRRARLAGRLRVRTFDKLQQIYRLGDPPDGLWVLLEGEVRLISYSATGGEVLGLILRPGRWFGELSVLDGGPRPHDAIALRPSRVAVASLAAIGELARDDPEFWRSLAVLSCHHHRRTLARIERNRFQTSKARLAALLSATVDEEKPEDPIRISQAELANTVGVSRQRLNRLLAELRAEQILRTAYGAIVVTDRKRLRDQARG
jgi:CRP/FNR family transcriptional regulator, cyclic AMP receptor protein